MLRRTDPLRVKVRGGFSLLELKRTPGMRGYNAVSYKNLGMRDLMRFDNAIVPVRVHAYNHVVVFRGMRDDDRAMLADPAFGNRIMSVNAFTKAWAAGLAFVVTGGSTSTAVLVPEFRPGEICSRQPNERYL